MRWVQHSGIHGVVKRSGPGGRRSGPGGSKASEGGDGSDKVPVNLSGVSIFMHDASRWRPHGTRITESQIRRVPFTQSTTPASEIESAR